MPRVDERKARAAYEAFLARFKRARQQLGFRPFASRHEGYAILKEELEELWDAIKADNELQAQYELVDLGAMALAFFCECEPGVRPKDPAA